MLTVEVPLGARSYPIHIGSGLLARAGALLRPRIAGNRVVVVTNPTVAAHWQPALRAGLDAAGYASETIIVPDGEAHKDLATLELVLSRLIELRAERGTAIVAVGGGVVGDVAGFAAAVYLRGVPCVQVPTTLLAQVDSSVGGKTAVNHPLGKNLIGAFHQPAAVLIDTDCLRTLPDRELYAGLAEVIKYGAIRDVAFFDWLDERMPELVARDAAALEHAIGQSCRIKAAIVGADERETGERALLNFGHTFGHAIETAAGYGTWLHGEAVAAGMVLAARLSEMQGALDAHAVARLRELVRRARLRDVPPPIPVERWLELMSRDKKVLGGTVRLVLLDRLGAARVRADVPAEAIRAIVG